MPDVSRGIVEGNDLSAGDENMKLIYLGRISQETRDLHISITPDGSSIMILGKCRSKSGNLLSVWDFGHQQVKGFSNVSPFPDCGTL